MGAELKVDRIHQTNAISLKLMLEIDQTEQQIFSDSTAKQETKKLTKVMIAEDSAICKNVLMNHV